MYTVPLTVLILCSVSLKYQMLMQLSHAFTLPVIIPVNLFKVLVRHLVKLHFTGSASVLCTSLI